MADFGLEPAQRGETNKEFVVRLIREERKKRTVLYRVNRFLRELWEAICADWKSFWKSVGRFMAKEIPPRKHETVEPADAPPVHFVGTVPPEPKVADTVTVNGEEYHVTREMHVTRVPEEIAPIFSAAPEELGKVERSSGYPEHTPDMHDCPDCGIPVVPKGISRDLHGKKRGELKKKSKRK